MEYMDNQELRAALQQMVDDPESCSAEHVSQAARQALRLVPHPPPTSKEVTANCLREQWKRKAMRDPREFASQTLGDLLEALEIAGYSVVDQSYESPQVLPDIEYGEEEALLEGHVLEAAIAALMDEFASVAQRLVAEIHDRYPGSEFAPRLRKAETLAALNDALHQTLARRGLKVARTHEHIECK